jgi:hypothetical protein
LALLLGAALVGLAGGLIWARAGHHLYEIPDLSWGWLVIIAFLPQFFAFVLPATRNAFPTDWVPAALVGSQAVLLVFALVNIKRPGFWLLGLGLVLNLVVISLNGGMMPISPETIQRLYPNGSIGAWQIGQRLGLGKDIVLTISETRLWVLSDCFTLPNWFSYRVAFSLGDVLIAVGAFWLLLAFGGRSQFKEKLS